MGGLKLLLNSFFVRGDTNGLGIVGLSSVFELVGGNVLGRELDCIGHLLKMSINFANFILEATQIHLGG